MKRENSKHCLPGDAENLLTVSDVAKHCKVSSRTVWRWIDDKLLKVVRFGRLIRIRPHDLEAFIKEHLV